MGFNITGSHAFGIHGEDLLLNILTYAGLILFDELRGELSLAVSGDRDFNFTKAGAKVLFAMPIAAIVGIFVLIVVLTIAQRFIHLGFKAVFHKFGNGFP